jgi:hypothetical protein
MAVERGTVKHLPDEDEFLDHRGKGNSGRTETTGAAGIEKTRQIGPKEGKWVCNPDRAGSKRQYRLRQKFRITLRNVSPGFATRRCMRTKAKLSDEDRLVYKFGLQ